MRILVQEENFDLSDECLLVRGKDTNIGAVVSFVGTVRDIVGESLEGMDLEHYPGMTESALKNIADEAIGRWELGDITIIHRVGKIAVGEQIVLVITTSKHRKSAFESCEFIMDYLKTQAPFWKKEYNKEGGKWVDAVEKDDLALKKWESKDGYE